jgi:transposase
MAKNQKSYTEEFRREAVRLMETSGKSVAQVARDLGINDNMLYRWRKRYGNASRKGQREPLASVDELTAELQRVRQELEVVRQERDILKKAINIVSRSQG